MAKSLLLGSVLGGLIVFVWSTVSWVVLPWHDGTFASLQNEEAVAGALMDQAPRSGLYLLPNMPHADMDDAAMAEFQKRQAQGPHAFIAFKREGIDGMGAAMVAGLLTNVIAAFIVTWIIAVGAARAYWLRVAQAVGIALAAGVMVHLAYWNWWQFPLAYTAIGIVDLVIAWFLAGLVIARLIPKHISNMA